MDTQTLLLRPPVWALLLAVLIGGGFYLGGKTIEAQDHTLTTISVSGEGKVTAPPDIAELVFGVQTGRQDSAKTAMQLLTQNMTKVIDAVKASGVAEKDIATEQFSLNPEYDWTDGKQVSRGFQAMETLRVKVRDLDKVSDVLGSATNAGANQAGSVSFTMDDPEVLRAQAREKAIAQAQGKALKLAGDLGLRLGKIKGFSEGGVTPPMPLYRSEMAVSADMGGGGTGVPLPSGQQDVTAQVTITYELR